MRTTHHLVIKRAGALRAPGGDVHRVHRICELSLTRSRYFRIIFTVFTYCVTNAKRPGALPAF